MYITELTDEKVTFDDGTTVEYEHEQDCCEHVYAKFENLRDSPLMYAYNTVNTVEIEKVPSVGFKICGYFVPCYNQQNGYYSGNLTILVTKPNGEVEKIDISDCVEDWISF